MSIAQRSVAGEGEAHPIDSEFSALEAQLDELELARNLPYPTLRAHQRALEITTLSKRARAALASIALVVDARKPLNSVFARRSYLSRRAGQSERTWYRAEQDLVEAGLITVSEQIRKSRGGLFGAAYIHLSEQAAKALGLIASAKEAKLPATPKPDVVDSELKTDDSTLPAQPTATVSDRFTYKVYPYPPSQRRQPGQLPEDVQPLLAVGFQKNFIFWLMGVARRTHGKKLGDIVTACWDSIKKANKPIPYLFALLRSGTDFAWLAKQRQVALVEARMAEERHAAAEAERDRLAGERFVTADGAKRFEVSSDGQTLTVECVTEESLRTAGSNWIDGFVTALNAGRIRLAQPSDDTHFAAARDAHRLAKQIEQQRPARDPLVDAMSAVIGLSHRAVAAPDADQLERSWTLSSVGNSALGGLRSLLRNTPHRVLA
ncbi:hypothetical protein [Burkholderia sp. Tr-20390]|uniref:hypothetical protein n=1 Tax=Burkholderia sp. Tr-20390 TaxID=2703904 RepID=UPI00197FA54E|nr:hypothetical protein [Burkholderia sp. Tr-20390]MBN3729353.1 hypothetical protein [Burkholderia sp. Tr-20390]